MAFSVSKGVGELPSRDHAHLRGQGVLFHWQEEQADKAQAR
jgi:hypothetical protein